MLSAGISDGGLVREHNEDAIIMEERGSSGIDGRHFRGLYVLSDGMGGAEAGEVASRITTCTIVDELKVDSEKLRRMSYLQTYLQIVRMIIDLLRHL